MSSPMITQFFPPLKNDLILRAARGEKVERVPVWLMRQAGRYLPEYNAYKKEHSADFFKTVQTPSMACEITLQPLRRFDLDAAIIFSDILVIPQALGMEVDIVEGKGVVFSFLLETPDDMERLNTDVDVVKELHYVMDAITLTRHQIEGKCPLFGFSGAPWTLMKFMIDGGSHSPLPKARKWLVKYPKESHNLLSILTSKVIDYLVAQIKAGAQIVQVFDSCAGELGPIQFNKFSLPYLKDIAYGVKDILSQEKIEPVPMVVFAKDAHFALEDLSKIGYEVVSLDWTQKPLHARRLLGAKVTAQGNLDPALLYAPQDELKHAVKEMLEKFGTTRYIANLGHGIHKDTDPENVKVFIDAVHYYSEDMIARQ
ncbi:uroporphyrinogen decarboxylase-like [Pecten maximus]|uniref:uroporphyrinogen decarboxylase-like n=1 Tax=Pecten maximus TaxID=6579 RepID=UPI001458522F|nr:uroporphyrinogen decarboxylase-like [Pecten maximus]